jgi:hypothetical protein
MGERSERIDYFMAALGYHLNFEVDPLVAFHSAIQDYRFVYLDTDPDKRYRVKPDWPKLLKGL